MTREEAEATHDYLMSGGAFTNIMVPRMFIKKLFNADNLQQFDNTQEGNTPHHQTSDGHTEDGGLKQGPLRAPWTRQLERVNQKGLMGENGEHMHSYKEKLMFNISLCEWATMPPSEALILFWLKDLKSKNKNQVALGELVHRK